MPYLSWISDEKLEEAVLHVYHALGHALEGHNLEKFQKNIIDPFSLLLQTMLTEQKIEEWIIAETQRQVQKTTQNALGEMHEIILGAVDGWERLDNGHESGLDIRRTDGTIYAEVKNKYNTLNSNSETETYRELWAIAESDERITAYLVHIIRERKRPYDEIWVKNEEWHPRVRKISGERFYELVTGSATALEDLYTVLPKVIAQIILNQGKINITQSKTLQELSDKIGTEKPTGEGIMRYFFASAYPNREASE